MAHHLIQAGVLLVILGLITGLAIPALKNKRMALASHLQGITNGPLLIVLGLIWPILDLSHGWQVTAYWLALYGTFANWLATFLSAAWGSASFFAPAATSGHTGRPWQKSVVDALFLTLGAAILAAMVIVLVGV